MRRGPRRQIPVVTLLILVAVAWLSGVAGSAQIPETFTNLKVLPESISQPELTAIMRGFASSLGVRCNHCHVGENPDTLEGYDFASDEKETKKTARVMLRMTASINAEFLPETGRENRIEVQCGTCHRGIKRPESISKLVLAAIDAEGLDAAIAQYRELRAAYFGGDAYDFSPQALAGAGVYPLVRENLLPPCPSRGSVDADHHIVG